jgi:hypothetical protein
MTAVALLVGLAATARADTITPTSAIITSDGTAADANELNSAGPTTITIAPHPGWAAALPGSSWVSYTVTGDPAAPGYSVVSNGTIVAFTDSFTLPGPYPFIGTLTVRADDSVAVFLNSSLLVPEATMAGNSYTVCSDFPIGCTVLTQGNIPLLLNPGANTLEFRVAQRAAVSFGLNYRAELVQTPEPATMLLLGTGLAGIAGAARRRLNRNRKEEE